MAVGGVEYTLSTTFDGTGSIELYRRLQGRDSHWLPCAMQVGSLSGEVGLPMRSAYCASKFAIAGWLDAVRIEMKMQKIPLQITGPPPAFCEVGRRRGWVGADTSAVYLRAVASPSSVDTPFRTHNIGPRPKMSADKCADLIIAGWEAGQDKIFVPAKVGLLTIAPQWVCDFMIQKDQKKLFSALLEASHGSSD